MLANQPCRSSTHHPIDKGVSLAWWMWQELTAGDILAEKWGAWHCMASSTSGLTSRITEFHGVPQSPNELEAQKAEKMPAIGGWGGYSVSHWLRA